LKRKGYSVDSILEQTASYGLGKKSVQNRKKLFVIFETTENLRNSLCDAIKTCCSNSKSVINSSSDIQIVGESLTYCNITHGMYKYINIINLCSVLNIDIFLIFITLGHSLSCVGNLQEIKLYVPEDVDRSEILSQSRAAPLNHFVNILKDLGEVFDLSPEAIHVFYDNCTGSIAFNRNRALFFNLKFYIVLHDDECKIKPTTDAMSYWFMTICHELAHNFVSLHDSIHEVGIDFKGLIFNIIYNLTYSFILFYFFFFR